MGVDGGLTEIRQAGSEVSLFGIGSFSPGSLAVIHTSSLPWSTCPLQRIDRMRCIHLSSRVRRLSTPTAPGPAAARTWPAVVPHTLRAQAIHPCFPPPPPHSLPALHPRPRARTSALHTARRNSPPQTPICYRPAFRAPLAADHDLGLSGHLNFTKHPMRRSFLGWIFVLAFDFRIADVPCGTLWMAWAEEPRGPRSRQSAAFSMF